MNVSTSKTFAVLFLLSTVLAAPNIVTFADLQERVKTQQECLPLHEAIHSQNPELLLQRLFEGALVNRTTRLRGQTPLDLAILGWLYNRYERQHYAYVEMIERLILLGNIEKPITINGNPFKKDELIAIIKNAQGQRVKLLALYEEYESASGVPSAKELIIFMNKRIALSENISIADTTHVIPDELSESWRCLPIELLVESIRQGGAELGCPNLTKPILFSFIGLGVAFKYIQ